MMMVTAVHRDTASLERHLAIGGDQFRAVGRFIRLRSIEVFGEVGDAARRALEAKARDLGTDVSISVQPIAAGFARLPTDAG